MHRLESMPENSLLYNAYKESKILDSCNINSWFSNANYLCKKIDIVWSKCKSMKTTTLKKQLKKNMRQEFLHYWSMKREEGHKSGKLTTYFYIKTNFEFEKYLSLKKFEHRKNICKFRISAHNLRIESGRYEKITNKEGQKTTLERNERICKLCDMNCVEDEIHSLIECPLYITDRYEFFEEINKNNKNFYSLSNKEKFLWIMSNENDRLLTRLGNFLISIFKTRNSTIQEQKI